MSQDDSRKTLSSDTETRLMTLDGLTEDGHLLAHLELIDLSDANRTKYHALSYLCGDPEPVSRIYLTEGGYIPLARNVTDALRSLLRRGYHGPMWVDAIAINQQDIEERNQQVKLMTRIYESASDVLIWLGADDRALSKGIHLLEKLANACGDSMLSIDTVLDVDDHSLLKRVVSETTEEDWEVLSKIFTNPYFGRSWIIQEASTNSPLRALSGDITEFDFTILFRAASYLKHAISSEYIALSGPGPVITPLVGLHRLWMQRQGGRKISPFAMPTIITYKSHDPRDKFFAVNGIVDIPEDFQRFFVVDYGRPVWFVYSQAVRGTIASTGNLSLLSFRNHEATSPEEFPSWALGYDRAEVTLFHHDPGRPESEDDKNRSPMKANASAEVEVSVRYDDDPRVLTLLGLQISGLVIETVDLKQKPSETFDSVFDFFVARYLTLLQHNRIDRFRFAADCAEATTYRYSESVLWGGLPRLTYMVDFKACMRRLVETSKTGSKDPQFVAAAEILIRDLDSWGARIASTTTEPIGSGLKRYAREVVRVCSENKLLITESGHVGCGPRETEVGDHLVVLFGGVKPFVLRKQDNGQYWQRIGTAWLAGYMDGEALADPNLKPEWFSLK